MSGQEFTISAANHFQEFEERHSRPVPDLLHILVIVFSLDVESSSWQSDCLPKLIVENRRESCSVLTGFA